MIESPSNNKQSPSNKDNRMELINENYKAFCDALLEAGGHHSNKYVATSNSGGSLKRKMLHHSDGESPRSKRDYHPDTTTNSFVSLSRPNNNDHNKLPMRNELESIIEGRPPSSHAADRGNESPLNLCTSPQRTSPCPTTPDTSPLHDNGGNISPLPNIPTSSATTRVTPELKLTLKHESEPDVTSQSSSAEKPAAAVASKKTTRKLSDRSRPCPIDLSRSKTILEDGVVGSPMLPIHRSINNHAAMTQCLNTPDSVCRRTPSETNASFFGAANMLNASPMVSAFVYFAAITKKLYLPLKFKGLVDANDLTLCIYPSPFIRNLHPIL